ncbi:hypothetical protein HanXRQr2_Chr09g0410661 [Helianthus annuus]|uniref:Uncharacterized protein n=1 Tax=Helianthus annuus TaxID=4232 RepID=A0A9K3NAY4_HELAN|nr:hypothetical protein HanXRQr2_Chr09g0410661 [Helianthus annuus]
MMICSISNSMVCLPGCARSPAVGMLPKAIVELPFRFTSNLLVCSPSPRISEALTFAFKSSIF